MSGESDTIRTRHHDCIAELHRRRIHTGKGKFIHLRISATANHVAFAF